MDIHEENMSLEMVKLDHELKISDITSQYNLAREKLRESSANDRLNAEISVKQNMGTGI